MIHSNDASPYSSCSSSTSSSNSTSRTSLGSTHDIRVLDLLPCDPNENDTAPIQCSIRTIQLSSDYGGGASEEYEAISYAWIHETPLIPIFVSGQEIAVMPTLYAALKQLRLQDCKRTLWIDQLCINQSDAKEKSEQVCLMRYIYSNCVQCLVWLGEIPFTEGGIVLKDAESAFEIIEYLAKGYYYEVEDEYKVKGIMLASIPDSIPDCLHRVDNDDDDNEPYGHSKSAAQAMKALKYIVKSHNPWWRRVWTVQEAILPSDGTFLWGPLSLSWETMHRATMVWVGDAGVLPTPVYDLVRADRDYMDYLGNLMSDHIWLESARIEADPLLVMVKKWRGRQASEARDNIYALMGLVPCPKGLTAVGKCDYEMPIVEAFSSFTLDVIVDEESLKPLIIDVRIEPGSGTPGLPNWALDMAGNPRYEKYWYPMYSYEEYNAADGLEPPDWREVRDEAARDNYRTLNLQGFLMDKIQDIKEGISWSTDKHEDDIPLWSTVQSWLAYYKPPTNPNPDDASSVVAYNQHHNSYMNAFARLILGDLVRNDNVDIERHATEQDIQQVVDYLSTAEEIDIDYELQRTAAGTIRNQTFFVTQMGYIGLGHRETQIGDEVWIFPGCNVPLTIRSRGEEQQQRDQNTPQYGGEADKVVVHRDFVGPCYVQGIMQGEAIRDDDGIIKLSNEKTVKLY